MKKNKNFKRILVWRQYNVNNLLIELPGANRDVRICLILFAMLVVNFLKEIEKNLSTYKIDRIREDENGGYKFLLENKETVELNFGFCQYSFIGREVVSLNELVFFGEEATAQIFYDYFVEFIKRKDLFQFYKGIGKFIAEKELDSSMVVH